jgi:hypothetical protein
MEKIIAFHSHCSGLIGNRYCFLSLSLRVHFIFSSSYRFKNRRLALSLKNELKKKLKNIIPLPAHNFKSQGCPIVKAPDDTSAQAWGPSSYVTLIS